MTTVTAGLVNELRQRTGVGMMECKKALVECGGDIEKAGEHLRKKGLAKAAQKSDRTAAEGLVGVFSIGKSAGMVEVSSETDFIGKEAGFQSLVAKAAQETANNVHTVESLQNAPFNGEQTIQENLTQLVFTIGEKMEIRRLHRLSVEKGYVSTYVHSATAPGMGKIGVLVALESDAPTDKLDEIGRKIAMHIAASTTLYLHRDEVPNAMVEKEKEILTGQATLNSNKPAEFIAKMVEGRMGKFYSEIVLLEQPFVMDSKMTVSEFVASEAKELGTEVVLKGFKKFIVGEGVEKKIVDFAAEVASMTKG